MSEYYTQTVRIESVVPHPNADTLDIATVLGEYPVIVKRGAFGVGDLATYISVDSCVPLSHPWFEFLRTKSGNKTHHRVRAMKLRGTFSMGLLVPHVELTAVGDDVAEKLGVLKYESPEEQELNRVISHNSKRKAKPVELQRFNRRVTFLCAFAWIVAVWGLALVPALLACAAIAAAGVAASHWYKTATRLPNVPVYDIDGFRNHPNVFEEGEPVWVTEKIHGQNAKFVHTGRKFFFGSRTMFRGRDGNVWHRIADGYGLEKILKNYPGLVLFGEVYGHKVQDLTYGCEPGEIRFVAFDAMNLYTREYMPVGKFLDFCKAHAIPVVPSLYCGPFDREKVLALAEGKTTMGASHVREGIVIKPMEEHHLHGLGRKILKFCGQGYYLRKEAA